MAKLVIHQPDGSMREVKLDRDRITLGRRADHDICLPYPAVSADHAEIITVVADSFLHDLGSTNGTLVNGERVSKHFLRNHDRIDIARQQLVYLTNDAETVEPLAPARPAAMFSGTEPALTVHSEAPEQASHDAADEPEIADIAPVDELLTDLMDMHAEDATVVEMPPAVSIVRPAQEQAVAERPTVYAQSTAGVYIEVMSGPNAGQITPMTKDEFVFGKAGASVAAIRRSDGGYRLIPLNVDRIPTLNGRPIEASGAWLEFGDTIGVGGVVLRFSRRAPL